ncbi:hypothetical protein AN958_08979 [Leucoagaricus sp. SymC.cos]|nr:hypothetical protein AN958_08979 [Leucoagaricus sp. SymC.cos]
MENNACRRTPTWRVKQVEKAFEAAKKAACEAFDSLMIRHFMNHSWRFMSAYHQGLTRKAAEWAVCKQKGHQTVSRSAMMHIESCCFLVDLMILGCFP